MSGAELRLGNDSSTPADLSTAEAYRAASSADIRERLGIPAGAMLSRGTIYGSTISKWWDGYRLDYVGVGGFRPGFVMDVRIRLAIVTHPETRAAVVVEVDEKGHRRELFVDLERDSRPSSLTLLQKGRRFAALQLNRQVGRPTGTGTIQNDDEIRSALAELGDIKRTRRNVATAARVDEDVLKRYHRSRRITWPEFLASLE